MRRLTENDFWGRVDLSDGSEACWHWLGRVNQDGYGKISYQMRDLSSHRLSWELIHGPIPEGMNVLHKCDNPPCVNPKHLYLGTPKDNIRDAIERNRFDPQLVSRYSRVMAGHKARQAKIKDAESIKEIRRRYAAGELQTALAKEFGIRQGLISNIVNHKTYKATA